MNLYNKNINFNIKSNTHNLDKITLALSRLPERISEHTDKMIKDYVKKVDEDAKKVKPIRFNSTNDIIDQFTKLAEQQNRRKREELDPNFTMFWRTVLPLNLQNDIRVKDLGLPAIKGITYVIDDFIPEDQILVIDKKAVQFIKDTDTGKEYIKIKKNKNKKISTKRKKEIKTKNE